MRYVLILALGLAACESTTGPVCLDCGVQIASGPPAAGEVPLARPGSVQPVTASGLPPLDGTPLAAETAAAGAEVSVAAVAAPAAAGALGSVVASLGDPTKKGLWVETGLVSAPQKGRVTTASGQSIEVDLLPGPAGTSARMSVAAYRALGLKITELPTLTVSGL
jgi:hypothetical protein